MVAILACINVFYTLQVLEMISSIRYSIEYIGSSAQIVDIGYSSLGIGILALILECVRRTYGCDVRMCPDHRGRRSGSSFGAVLGAPNLRAFKGDTCARST